MTSSKPWAMAAVFDSSRFYRYALGRRWGEGAPLMFITLNPDTADAYEDDATIRRCIHFAKRGGYGAICVMNLFAYCTTQPDDLLQEARSGEDVIGPYNDDHIRSAKLPAGRVIAAWGGTQAALRGRIPDVLALVWPRALWCLGQTQGDPQHPLDAHDDQPLELWRPGESLKFGCVSISKDVLI